MFGKVESPVHGGLVSQVVLATATKTLESLDPPRAQDLNSDPRISCYRGQNILIPNTIPWHSGYFESKAFEEQQVQELFIRAALSRPK